MATRFLCRPELEIRTASSTRYIPITTTSIPILPITLTTITQCIGPYTNVLDLQLFPSMSHRHSAQLQLYNNTEATIEKIWKTVENVWNETSSAEVARAFVLAFRVMNVIIDEEGDNTFLSNGTPHCNVRRDFCDTPTGVRRKLANFFL